MINPELMQILRCPKCRGTLDPRTEPAQGLHCGACHLLYPIVEDIPNMLIEEALPDPPRRSA